MLTAMVNDWASQNEQTLIRAEIAQLEDHNERAEERIVEMTDETMFFETISRI